MNSLTQLSMYTESDNEENEHFEKRLQLPLPDFIGNSTSIEQPQEKINEEGKIRNFPHCPGNWATYLYVPLDLSEFFNYIDGLFKFFKPLELKLVNDFHISLTKTVILRHHWIPQFVSDVKNNLSQVTSFKIHLRGLTAFTNEEKTRSFLSLKVIEGEDDLKSVVSHLNNNFCDYNLPKFYKDPSFHVSLFWGSGEVFSEINKYIDLLPLNLKNFSFCKEVSHCVCATGNKRFTFNFINANFS